MITFFSAILMKIVFILDSGVNCRFDMEKILIILYEHSSHIHFNSIYTIPFVINLIYMYMI